MDSQQDPLGIYPNIIEPNPKCGPPERTQIEGTPALTGT